MVYKIQGDFSQVKFPQLFEDLGKEYKIIYKNGSMYISSKIYQEDEQERQRLMILLNDYNTLVYFLINEKNIMREDEEIRNWCRDNLVRLDKERYEKEKQDKLKEVMNNLDKMEFILKEKYRKEVKDARRGEKEKGQTPEGSQASIQ